MTIRSHNAHGFTLVEMLMVLAVLGILFAMAVGISTSMVNNAKSDSAVVSTLNAVELARNRAIGERREFQLIFTAPNALQISRIEVPSGTATPVLNTFLENGQQYVKFSSVGDTPDLFGTCTSGICFGVTPTIRFTSDGSLLDSAGDPVNGSVFFGDPVRSSSARAITIFGATGLVHVWKWDGLQWTQ